MPVFQAWAWSWVGVGGLVGAAECGVGLFGQVGVVAQVSGAHPVSFAGFVEAVAAVGGDGFEESVAAVAGDDEAVVDEAGEEVGDEEGGGVFLQRAGAGFSGASVDLGGFGR